jgi:Secretion system C-terminal sorting domain
LFAQWIGPTAPIPNPVVNGTTITLQYSAAMASAPNVTCMPFSFVDYMVMWDAGTPDVVNIMFTVNNPTVMMTVSYGGFDYVINLNMGVLPIELTQFQARKQDNEVKIAWKTASEHQNSFFSLQRSWDAVTFETIARQEGAADENQANTYSFSDKEVLAQQYKSVAYYRLAQTDEDGRTTFSAIVVVRLTDEAAIKPWQIAHFTPSNFMIKAQNAEENIRIRLLDMTGKVLATQTISLAEGENQIDFEYISENNSGIYLVEITNGQEHLVEKKGLF